jgi:hypothetical protein
MYNRGSTFADRWRANSWEPVGLSWTHTLLDLGWQQGATNCDFQNPGPGGGFNGCGCNTVMAADSSQWISSYRLQIENWGVVQDDWWDAWAQGSASSIWVWASCNYDVITYPWELL